jgi:hypothetical protein
VHSDPEYLGFQDVPIEAAAEVSRLQDWPLADSSYIDYYLDSSSRANTADGDGELHPAPAGGERADTYL